MTDQPRDALSSATDAFDYLDGNAAAGPLREIFSVDLTAARGECAGCGRTGAMGEVRVYTHAPGIVARCPGCDGVLMRLVQDPGPSGRMWLDLRGLTVLQVSPRA
jgi:hypothetical protein